MRNHVVSWAWRNLWWLLVGPRWWRFNAGHWWRRRTGRLRSCVCGRWEEQAETGAGVRWCNDSGAIDEGVCSRCLTTLYYDGTVRVLGC